MTMLKRFYLMTSSLAVAGMVTAPLQAMAQDAPGPGGDNAAPYNQAGGDPPTRVGRLATMDGTVSTHGAGDGHWSPATLNAPVATGDAYWTEPSALAKIEMTASAVWMDASTEFDLTTLDDTTMHAAEPQGELYLQLRSLQPGETFTIETPRGTVTMATDGSYDIAAGDTDHPTTVTVLDGAASITGSNISLQVHADQTASVTGSTTFDGTVGPAVQDDFLVSMRKREAPAQVSGAPPPPIVAQMTGGDDLVQYGAWQDDQDYGQVWYPQVGSDWVPYREGRWSYVAPWGWTWEDNAPWGFAPFHYGRWVQVGPRWGWVPGYAGYGGGGYGRPAYAPALVGFFGIGLGVGIGIGEGFRPGANVGWVPLGPREAYYPPYRASRTYLTRVNVTNIRNVTNITNEEGSRRDLGIDRYTNARAATVVPARAMQDSRPIAGAYRRPTAAELAGARGVVDRAPIAPGARTAGLTPHTAEAMRISDYRPRAAPGPQVSARPEHAGRGNLPALREAHGSAEHPAAAPGPELRGERTPGGLPALRTPGERPDRPAASDAATGAPGPRIAHGTEAGRPALRAPGAEREARPAPNAGEMAHTPSERHPAVGTTPGSAVTHREATTPDHAEPARRESAAHTPAPRPTEPAAPVHQPRVEPKAQPRPEPRAEPRPEPRAQPRPEPRPEPRAEPRPQPRVEAPRPPPPPAPAARPAPKPPQKGEPPH